MPPRRSSRQNHENGDGADADASEENPKKTHKPQTKKDQDQWIMLLDESSIEESLDIENKPVFCQVRHPKTEKGAMFLFSQDDKNIFEVLRFKEDFRSWLIGSSVQHDGSLLVTTPVDPVFLVLPYLIKAEETGKYMTLDQIVCDEEFPECHRLCNTSGISELDQVTNIKGDADLRAYRFDKDKTLSWLKLKTERTAEVLSQKQISVAGSQSASFVRSKKETTTTKDDYVRYAFGVVADYLPVELSTDLREYLGIPAVAEKRAAEPEDNHPAKRVKVEDVAPTEDYSTANGKADKSKKSKVSTAQKKLAQVDKSGMKSMMSFFSPKTKS